LAFTGDTELKRVTFSVAVVAVLEDDVVALVDDAVEEEDALVAVADEESPLVSAPVVQSSS
tara:strand:+ start:2394 stop:2576 length:183 start_codon:yes stop_codon:yes gene_type:complete